MLYWTICSLQNIWAFVVRGDASHFHSILDLLSVLKDINSVYSSESFIWLLKDTSHSQQDKFGIWSYSNACAWIPDLLVTTWVVTCPWAVKSHTWSGCEMIREWNAYKIKYSAWHTETLCTEELDIADATSTTKRFVKRPDNHRAIV